MNKKSDFDRCMVLVVMIAEVSLIILLSRIWPYSTAVYQVMGSIALVVVLVAGIYNYLSWYKVAAMPPA